MNMSHQPGHDAVATHGWWYAHRYLLLRRLAQFFFLALFLTGPLFGLWITKGTLASSMTFDVLPLTDPFIFLQSLVSGHWPEFNAILGALIVLAGYLLLGGRSYCSWVCPINPVTDLASWLRRRLGFGKGVKIKRGFRLYALAAVLAVCAVTGVMAWELVNPITTLHRGLIFGFGWGAMSVLAIFTFDLFVAEHGWCGHLCPVGAFYGVVGKATVLRVSAPARQACNDCMDCFAVCPENQVISPALRGDKTGHGPLILSGDCTTCGRCIDVCAQDVFRLTHRFDQRLDNVGADLSANLEERAAA